MKPKERVVLDHAVTIGTEYGIRRHYKHLDCPLDEREIVALAATVAEYVMLEIDTWFTSSEDEDG